MKAPHGILVELVRANPTSVAAAPDVVMAAAARKDYPLLAAMAPAAASVLEAYVAWRATAKRELEYDGVPASELMPGEAIVRRFLEAGVDKEVLLGEAAKVQCVDFAECLLAPRIGASGLVTLDGGKSAREIGMVSRHAGVLELCKAIGTVLTRYKVRAGARP